MSAQWSWREGFAGFANAGTFVVRSECPNLGKTLTPGEPTSVWEIHFGHLKTVFVKKWRQILPLENLIPHNICLLSGCYSTTNGRSLTLKEIGGSRTSGPQRNWHPLVHHVRCWFSGLRVPHTTFECICKSVLRGLWTLRLPNVLSQPMNAICFLIHKNRASGSIPNSEIANLKNKLLTSAGP